MSEKICLHAKIRGKVQGVWFRASTQREARNLGLSGWVRNCTDGQVEVMAIGPKEAVLSLEEWLHQGPPAAEVEAVEAEELPIPTMEDTDFKVI